MIRENESSNRSLQTLKEFPTAEAVLNTGEDKLTKKIALLCMRRSDRWAAEKSKKLLAAASRNPFRNAPYQSHLISLEMYIDMLLHFKEHLATLEKQIDALANEFPPRIVLRKIISWNR